MKTNPKKRIALTYSNKTPLKNNQIKPNFYNDPNLNYISRDSPSSANDEINKKPPMRNMRPIRTKINGEKSFDFDNKEFPETIMNQIKSQEEKISSLTDFIINPQNGPNRNVYQSIDNAVKNVVYDTQLKKLEERLQNFEDFIERQKIQKPMNNLNDYGQNSISSFTKNKSKLLPTLDNNTNFFDNANSSKQLLDNSKARYDNNKFFIDYCEKNTNLCNNKIDELEKRNMQRFNEMKDKIHVLEVKINKKVLPEINNPDLNNKVNDAKSLTKKIGGIDKISGIEKIMKEIQIINKRIEIQDGKINNLSNLQKNEGAPENLNSPINKNNGIINSEDNILFVEGRLKFEKDIYSKYALLKEDIDQLMKPENKDSNNVIPKESKAFNNEIMNLRDNLNNQINEANLLKKTLEDKEIAFEKKMELMLEKTKIDTTVQVNEIKNLIFSSEKNSSSINGQVEKIQNDFSNLSKLREYCNNIDQKINEVDANINTKISKNQKDLDNLKSTSEQIIGVLEEVKQGIYEIDKLNAARKLNDIETVKRLENSSDNQTRHSSLLEQITSNQLNFDQTLKDQNQKISRIYERIENLSSKDIDLSKEVNETKNSIINILAEIEHLKKSDNLFDKDVKGLQGRLDIIVKEDSTKFDNMNSKIRQCEVDKDTLSNLNLDVIKIVNKNQELDNYCKSEIRKVIVECDDIKSKLYNDREVRDLIAKNRETSKSEIIEVKKMLTDLGNDLNGYRKEISENKRASDLDNNSSTERFREIERRLDRYRDQISNYEKDKESFASLASEIARISKINQDVVSYIRSEIQKAIEDNSILKSFLTKLEFSAYKELMEQSMKKFDRDNIIKDIYEKKLSVEEFNSFVAQNKKQLYVLSMSLRSEFLSNNVKPQPQNFN